MYVAVANPDLEVKSREKLQNAATYSTIPLDLTSGSGIAN
jgi:hypothetical protein